MVLGTGYDLYLVHQSRHFFNENYTYEITRASPPHLGERPMKLDVGSFTQSATLSPSDGVINHGESLTDCIVSKHQLCGNKIQEITPPPLGRTLNQLNFSHIATTYLFTFFLILFLYSQLIMREEFHRTLLLSGNHFSSILGAPWF
jgi:hypothetical protein